MTGVAIVLTAVLFAFSGCRGGRTERAYEVATGGNAELGRHVIQKYDCGACHMIPGVEGARGLLAPPLIFFARRTYVAGQLPNTPRNLVRWVMDPQSVEPGTAMPDLGLSEREARHVAAYLYTLED